MLAEAECGRFRLNGPLSPTASHLSALSAVIGNVTDAAAAERFGDLIDLEISNLTEYKASVNGMECEHTLHACMLPRLLSLAHCVLPADRTQTNIFNKIKVEDDVARSGLFNVMGIAQDGDTPAAEDERKRSVTLKFEFVKRSTRQPVELPRLRMSFTDLDHASDGFSQQEVRSVPSQDLRG